MTGRLVLRFKDAVETSFDPIVKLIENPFEIEKTACIEIVYIQENNSIIIEFYKQKEATNE